MTLFVEEQGRGERTIALLHGFGGSHAVWKAMQGQLSGDCRTLAYDLPGHGESLGRADAVKPSSAAKALLADLSARGHERVHLAGHSMGGAVATLMAMMEPGRIASLTLLSPGGFGSEINHRLLMRFASARDRAGVEAALEAMFGWFSPVPEDVVEQALEVRSTSERTAMLQTIGRGLARDGRQGQLPREAVEALPMPVSVAWGELDNVLPARHAKGLPEHFSVHLFPDLGHMLPDEAPDEMVAIVRTTIARAS